jgi:methyl-accepting chemotaxis protein
MRSKIEAANEDNAALHGTIDELRLALDEVRRGAKQSERVVNHLQGLLDRQRGSTVSAAAELERLRAELTASRNEAALLLGSVERLGGLNKIKTGMISTLSLIMVVLGVICVWL